MKQNSKRITFAKAYEMKDYQFSSAVLKHLRQFNNGTSVSWRDIKKSFLIGFVKYLNGKVTQNSMRTYCSSLKSLLNIYAYEMNIPCKDYHSILSIKKVGVHNVYLTKTEIQLLINYVPHNEKERIIRNQFVISCLTGLRYSDALNLDINNKVGEEIVYLSQKTNSVIRTVICEVVDKYLKETTSKVYSHPTFNATIRAICENVGISETVKVVKGSQSLTGPKYKYISSHTARRSFATNLYLFTKDLVLVSQFMGHSNIAITQNYICCDMRDNQQVNNYFNDYSLKSIAI